MIILTSKSRIDSQSRLNSTRGSHQTALAVPVPNRRPRRSPLPITSRRRRVHPLHVVARTSCYPMGRNTKEISRGPSSPPHILLLASTDSTTPPTLPTARQPKSLSRTASFVVLPTHPYSGDPPTPRILHHDIHTRTLPNGC